MPEKMQEEKMSLLCVSGMAGDLVHAWLLYFSTCMVGLFSTAGPATIETIHSACLVDSQDFSL